MGAGRSGVDIREGDEAKRKKTIISGIVPLIYVFNFVLLA